MVWRCGPQTRPDSQRHDRCQPLQLLGRHYYGALTRNGRYNTRGRRRKRTGASELLHQCGLRDIFRHQSEGTLEGVCRSRASELGLGFLPSAFRRRDVEWRPAL